MSPDKIFLTVNGKKMSLAKLIENPAAATDVWVENCAGPTELPDLPAATVVRVLNCAGLTELPDLPAATVVRVENCAGLTELPDLPAAIDVRVENCAGLTELPDLPAATVVRVLNCAGLTELPDLPAAIDVWVLNCAGLKGLVQGDENPRGYKVIGVKLRRQWRIIAGCRNFSIEDARHHWGKSARKHAGCLAVAERVIAQIEALDAASTKAEAAE
jgi:hypothetical protein